MAVGGIGIPVVPVAKLIQQQIDADNSLLDQDGKGKKTLDFDSLTSYIINQFKINKDAKVNSGIEEEIINSVRAVNGEYSPEDLQKISSEGGSSIFMNITATKSRAAKSWLSDIFLPAKGKSWSLEPSRVQTIPDSIKTTIEQAINQEFQELTATQQGQSVSVNQAQQNITELNQSKRDIALSIAEEVAKEAKFQLLNMEKMIEDQLTQGKFDQALLTFLEDFCTYPTAFLKGPVICKKPKLYWNNGKAQVEDTYYFMNERVDPLDIYPSPDATSLNDGNLCEHLRMSTVALSNLKGIAGYSSDAINEILENEDYGNSWLDTGAIEQDKVDEEYRGDVEAANDGVVHGIHYFGTAPLKLVNEWKKEFKLDSDLEEWDLVEVEAIVASGRVIKCNINGDPLKRRPYYKASYMSRPGSFWGRSLPSLMSDIQRMCNAAARALANNMALGSGPMMEIYVDRLADNGAMTEMRPRMIVQTIPDPTGAGGRAVQFFQPAIIAAELLAVYNQFEQKADDVTGIPAYAYGNDRTGAVPATVGGLSIILESASKIIKDCVRSIDEGIIKPRIEYQFYWNLVYNQIEFTGDIEVIPRASSTLTTKASEALRRQEFLQITANELDQQVMGTEGRAEILRVMAEDLGLPASAIPSKLDIKRNQKKAEAQMQQMQQIEAQNKEADREMGIARAKIQVDGQERMHQGTLAMQDKKLNTDATLKVAELQQQAKETSTKHQLKGAEIATKTQTTKEANQIKEDNNVREIALKLKSGEGI